MRAIGPGSVSSLLKTALDVVYLIMWLVIGVLVVGAILVLFVQLERPATFRDGDFVARVTLSGPTLSIILAGAAIYVAIIQFVVARLRRLFSTLTAGDPFHPDNVRRLRAIGVGLAALESASVLGHVAAPVLLTGAMRVAPPLDVTSWFAVIVVFVLAEVFREGARLRREAELTI